MVTEKATTLILAGRSSDAAVRNGYTPISIRPPWIRLFSRSHSCTCSGSVRIRSAPLRASCRICSAFSRSRRRSDSRSSLTVTILSAGMSRSYVDQFRSRKSPTSTLTSAAWRMDKSPRSLSRTAGGRLLTRVAARRAHAESSPAGARLGDGSIDHDCADHPELGRRLRGVHVVSAEAHILVERHAVAAGTLAIRP